MLLHTVMGEPAVEYLHCGAVATGRGYNRPKQVRAVSLLSSFSEDTTFFNAVYI